MSAAYVGWRSPVSSPRSGSSSWWSSRACCSPTTATSRCRSARSPHGRTGGCSGW